MQLDSLRRLTVIDPNSACRLGTVVDYWINPGVGRVEVLVIRPLDIDQPQRIACARVARVGHDAVMLAPGAANTPSIEPIPANWLNSERLRDLVVYTDAGERLGTVAAALVDPLTLELQSYQLAVPFWRAWLPRRHVVSGDRVAWCGRDVLVVRTDEPAKLRPVGREDGEYAGALPAHALRQAAPMSRNGSHGA